MKSIMKRKKLPLRFKLGILSLVFCLSGAFQVFAQDQAISGTVLDQNTEEALIGATVMVKGTDNGTVTDIDGKFTLDVDPNSTLIISYVGFLTKEIQLSGQSSIEVILNPDISNLEQVVVIGYGTQKRKLATGASVHVKSEDIVKTNSVRLESSLQGLTPGVAIIKQSGQPGSDYNITIRGLGSVNGSSPLVLIDGVPGNLNMINPSDVASVDILKDAASAAIYGSRASDGVILITTKKGSSGKNQVSYDFYFGVSNPPKVDMLNAKEYAMIMNEQVYNFNPDRDPQFTDEEIAAFGEGTDWQEEASRKNAPIQNHYLGINGGNEFSNYSMSLSFTDESGIFDYQNKSQYERYAIRLNSDHTVNKYLKIGENLTYTHRDRTGLGVGNIYNNFMRTILAASPLIEAYDENQYDGFGRSEYISDQVNPLAQMHYNFNSNYKYDDVIGDIYAEFEPVSGLKFRSAFGGTLNFYQSSSVTDTFTITPINTNEIPDIDQNVSRNFNYNWDNTLTYQKSFSKHNVLAMVGTNAQKGYYAWQTMNIDGFKINPNLPFVPSNIGFSGTVDGDTALVYGDHGPGQTRFSIFGRLSYNYDEKYMVNTTLRRDGSSYFGPKNRYGMFPAVSLGWVISREDFFLNSEWLNFLKIRYSWGRNGKEPYDVYKYLATVGNNDRQYSFGNGWQTGISPDIMANPTLKWEGTTMMNIGFDSRFLNYFGFNFDLYKKTSKDWIVPVPVPTITGINGISGELPLANYGNVVNRGIEFELEYNRNFNDLSVNISANAGFNQNEAIEVPNDLLHGDISVIYNGSQEFYRVEEGYPLGYFWGYEVAGIFQTEEEVINHINPAGEQLQPNAQPGDVKRMDINGDSVINDDDKVMIGNPHPDAILGLNLSLAYKGFDFSMYVTGMFGHQIVKSYRAEDRAYFNYSTEILNRWQWEDKNDNGIVDAGEGTSNTMPRVTGGTDRNNNWRQFSDLYVENADFVRIKSINIGYDFMKLFNDNAPFSQFRLYLAANNVLTLSKYTGLDPEVGYSAGAPYTSGIDIGFYPTAKTYLIGLNVKF